MDNDLFHAAEEVIYGIVSCIDDLTSLFSWSVKHGLANHPVVMRRTLKLVKIQDKKR